MNCWKNTARTLFSFLLVVSVTACGFHLRGSIPLSESIDNMYLNANSGPFRDQMEEILTKAGVILMPTLESAESQLSIQESVVQKTVGTLDEFGKANSYRLTYRVKYVLDTPEGKLIRSTVVTDRRQYDFDPDLVLSTEAEEEELILDMEESVALRIMRQLATITDESLL